jgi:hypothetical protein
MTWSYIQKTLKVLPRNLEYVKKFSRVPGANSTYKNVSGQKKILREQKAVVTDCQLFRSFKLGVQWWWAWRDGSVHVVVQIHLCQADHLSYNRYLINIVKHKHEWMND